LYASTTKRSGRIADDLIRWSTTADQGNGCLSDFVDDFSASQLPKVRHFFRRGLLAALQNATDEQLDMPIQCTDSHPVDENVYTLKRVICMGTVDQLDLRYAPRVSDNRRRHGNEIVLFCLGNPFSEDGASSYVMKDAAISGLSSHFQIKQHCLTFSNFSFAKHQINSHLL